jgi:ankyrin repeat protein
MDLDVGQLRRQAKELVQAARAGDEGALARLGGREPILARAQHVLAREHGHARWADLVAAAEATADAFVLAATDRRRARAEALLAARPALREDPWVGLVLGAGWEGDPSAPGGPRGWAPLLYVCHSVFASTALAGELLARGADPNATFRNEFGDMSALYGAAGVVGDPELTAVLLEAGADPDDGESLYHAAYLEDPACLRLLLAAGATTAGTNVLGAVLDEERPEHLALLLDAGADPGEGALVAHAVRRGRSPAVLRLLAAAGADVDRPGGETWRGAVPLRTPYQHAVLRGRDDQVAALAELGASTEVDATDRRLGALARGERAGGPLPDPLDVDGQEVVVLAALRGHLDAVLAAVGPRFRGVVGGSPEGELLHHAAWVGAAGVVRALLEAGADPLAPADAELATPLGWAALSSRDGARGADHVAVAELLVAAGAEVEPALLEVADGPLAAWLEDRVARRRRQRA